MSDIDNASTVRLEQCNPPEICVFFVLRQTAIMSIMLGLFGLVCFHEPHYIQKVHFYSIFGEGIEEEIAYEHSRKLG